jgi:hypothetical protein
MNKVFFTFACAAFLFICQNSPLRADSESRVEFREYLYKKNIYPDGSENRESAPEDVPYISVDMQFWEPVKYHNETALAGLRSFIRQMYSSGNMQKNINDMLRQSARDVIQDWQEYGLSVLEDFPDAVAAATWDYQRSMRCLTWGLYLKPDFSLIPYTLMRIFISSLGYSQKVSEF